MTELTQSIGGGLFACFDEDLECIAVSPDFSSRDTITYFTPMSIHALAAFSQRVQTELASRQAWKALPELKPTEVKLAEPP